MFYSVLALLQSIGTVPRKHSGAISLFDSQFVHSGVFPKELSAALHAAFVQRQADDYQRLDPVTVDEARAAVAAAERFVAAVRAHLVPGDTGPGPA